jgi:hypothetical protein
VVDAKPGGDGSMPHRGVKDEYFAVEKVMHDLSPNI